MDNFKIIKNNKVQNRSKDQMLNLLVSHQDFEIMVQKMSKDASVWIEPATEAAIFEFFYVLEGKLKVTNEGVTDIVNVNDSFYATNLKKAVFIEVLENAKVLYFTNSPMFNYLSNFQNTVNELIKKIDDQDHFTQAHCLRTTNYVKNLYQILSESLILDYESLVLASAIHDIGKYKANSKLQEISDDNDEKIYEHASIGAEIVNKAYGDKVANIILHHHENLDGSGYLKLTDADLSLEDRVLIVADRFDHLVNNQQQSMSPKDAAQYLYNLPNKYDRKITAILCVLVESKQI